MKKLLSSLFVLVIGCSGGGFELGQVAETDNPEVSEETGNKDSGQVNEAAPDAPLEAETSVDAFTDAADSATDTKEIDICGSKYSSVRTGDFLCADLVGNIKYIYAVEDAITKYMGCSSSPCTSYTPPTTCVDYFKKYTAPIHKCNCTDNVCTTISVLFRVDASVGVGSSLTWAKRTCDEIELNIGGKCTFT